MLAVNASELLRAYLLLFPESLQGCLHVLWPVVGYGAVRAARRSGVDVSVVDDLHLPAVLIRPIARSDLILLDDWILAVLPIPVGTLVAGDVGVRLDERRHSVFGYELQALDLLFRGGAPLDLFVSGLTSRAALVSSRQRAGLVQARTPLLELNDLVVVYLLGGFPDVRMLQAELELAVGARLQASFSRLLLLMLGHDGAHGVAQWTCILDGLLPEG